MATLLAMIAAPVHAVDPSLHNLDDLGAESFASPRFSLPAIESGPAAGVEITDIRDLGPQPRGPDVLQGPADLWERVRRGFAIPNLDGSLVVERQAWYAAKPTQIRIMAERSRRYLFHIVEELERRGMPTELALLPMVESAFNPMAFSRARASGLWQFIPSTGKNYNLDQNWWYDARRDIVASTSAALDYLQFLHDLHGDWHLALASYNWGEGAVGRAIEKNRKAGLPTDYASLAMPGETRLYVPKLQALKNIVANPAAAGIELDPIPNAPYFVTVTLTGDIDLRLAARLAEMPVDELIALNPGHNRPMVATAVSPVLVLPADRADVFAQNLQRHDKPLSAWRAYVFRAGDRLEKLAADHGLSVVQLRAINSFGAKTRVVAGQQILLPQRGSVPDTTPLPGQFQQSDAAAPSGRRVTHVVKRGETLSSIARRYNVRIDDLRRWNDYTALSAGQRLTLYADSAAPTAPVPASAVAATAPAKSSPPSVRAKSSAKRTTVRIAPPRPAVPTQVARRSTAS